MAGLCTAGISNPSLDASPLPASLVLCGLEQDSLTLTWESNAPGSGMAKNSLHPQWGVLCRGHRPSGAQEKHQQHPWRP